MEFSRNQEIRMMGCCIISHGFALFCCEETSQRVPCSAPVRPHYPSASPSLFLPSVITSLLDLILAMNVNSRSNVQGVGALPNVYSLRSIAPVLQFMQTFIQDERARDFLNEDGTSNSFLFN
jgi:hypothetical protein